MPDTTDVEIFEMTPVDYLDKMPDEKAVLKETIQKPDLVLRKIYLKLVK